MMRQLNFTDTRVIVDCTEIFIQRPSSLQSQILTFSNYKNHNTFKVLVGISPGGVVTFMLDLWGGRVSDREKLRKVVYYSCWRKVIM